MPVSKNVELNEVPALNKGPFLARRELGVINVGGNGKVVVDGKEWALAAREGLYVPQGTNTLVFASDSRDAPAKFYLASTPGARPVRDGEDRHQEGRTRCPWAPGHRQRAHHLPVHQSRHLQVRAAAHGPHLAAGRQRVEHRCPATCTSAARRRTFYFDLKPDARVVHIMGEPHETRHIFVANEEGRDRAAVGIHTGCGTSNYSFIWAMGGENQEYKDVAWVPMKS
jgi:4-deoxy-L-threo-5-hexosulose-uronate ketol-isomerase